MNLSFNDINVENFTLSTTDSAPSNTFEYHLSSDFLNDNVNTYNDTNMTTKIFNNVYELTKIPVSVNITESTENAGHYILKFKADDIVFKSKLTVDDSSAAGDSSEVYLEKMLPEDADISNPQPTVESVRDYVPDDLKLTYIQSVVPKEPEFQFYTDRNYKSLYIKVFSNRGSGVSDGWLSLNEDNKFIITDSSSSTDLYEYFAFILPSFVSYKLDDEYNGIPITTDLNSSQFYYTQEALASGPVNINLGSVKLIIQGYDLYSSTNNSINTPTENNDKYELLFLGIEGNYVNFCLEYVATATNNLIYFTDGSWDAGKTSVKCKLFKDIYKNGIYAYILLSDSGINTDEELLKNKVWLGIGDDGNLQLVENINSSINLLNYFTNMIYTSTSTTITDNPTTNITNTTEGFTNANSSPNFINYTGYRIISNPYAVAVTREPSASSCASYCYNRDPSNNIGAYFNRDADDFKCKCYSKINMIKTNNAAEETILFGTMAINHKNSSNVSRTLTSDSATNCSTSCLVDDNGVYTNKNKAFTFDNNKISDNCTCHVSTEITNTNADGKVTGPTQTYIEGEVINKLEQSDYIPLKKYFETSSLFNYFREPGMRTLLIIFKIISVAVALILYSYFSHEDMPVFRLIKSVFIIIFSELYLIYGFVKIVLMDYKKGFHET